MNSPKKWGKIMKKNTTHILIYSRHINLSSRRGMEDAALELNLNAYARDSILKFFSPLDHAQTNFSYPCDFRSDRLPPSETCLRKMRSVSNSYRFFCGKCWFPSVPAIYSPLPLPSRCLFPPSSNRSLRGGVNHLLLPDFFEIFLAISGW